MPVEVIVEADGGSRGNPGPAGYGAVVIDARTGELLVERSGFLGVATNNVAEYSGLLAGLRAARSLNPAARVRVRMDSKLVVEQMSGRWQIKHPALRPLAAEARRVLPSGQVGYEWMPRSQNKRADRLANKAMDAGQRGEAPIEDPLRTTPAGGAGAVGEVAAGGGAVDETEVDDGVGVQGAFGDDGVGVQGTFGDDRVDAQGTLAPGPRTVAHLAAPSDTRASSSGTEVADSDTRAPSSGARAADSSPRTSSSGARVSPSGTGAVPSGTPVPSSGARVSLSGTGAVPSDTRAPSSGARAVDSSPRTSSSGARTAPSGTSVPSSGTCVSPSGTGAVSSGAPVPSSGARVSPSDTPAPSSSTHPTPSDPRAARNLAAPDMRTPATLVLLRHGETPLTPQKRFSGSGGSDPGLSDVGRDQAARVAEALARRGTIEVIVASPLARTRETAEAVAVRLGLDVISEDGLRETDFGAWEGLTFGEVRERYPADMNAWLGDPEARPTGGGESFAEVAQRVAETRDRLTATYAGRTVLVVSHVTPIKTLIRLALGAPPEALFRMDLSAASLSAVAYYADGNASVRLVNETSHLR
ncbi:bifunctional RNase H/acid phosphatase [Streptomyces sp. S6]